MLQITVPMASARWLNHGPCTADESQRPVTIADVVNTQLQARDGAAVRAVRQRVHTRALTQDQFDALVSFTFNTGARGARHVLDAAEAGTDATVVSRMQANVFVHVRNADGRRLPAVRVPGLANRRREEVLPFQTPPAINVLLQRP